MAACCENCPYCYANRKGRSNFKGHSGYRAPRVKGGRSVGDFLKNKGADRSAEVSRQDTSLSQFAADFPCLHEWMTLVRWEDGSPRQTTTLTLFAEDGRWKACISDREEARVAFVSGWTWEEALRACEEGLLGSSLDWRSKGGFSNNRPKRT